MENNFSMKSNQIFSYLLLQGFQEFDYDTTDENDSSDALKDSIDKSPKIPAQAFAGPGFGTDFGQTNVSVS